MRRTAALLAPLALLLAACAGGEEPAAVWLYHMERQVHGPAPTGQLTCAPPHERCPHFHAPPGEVLRYARRGDPAVGGTDVVRGSARADGATLLLELSPDGAGRFRSFTRALAEEGRERGRVQHFVVAVDDEIVAFGGIDYEAYPEGLPGDAGIQLRLPSAEEAERIAARLRRPDPG
jgi:hypothetical protein